MLNQLLQLSVAGVAMAEVGMLLERKEDFLNPAGNVQGGFLAAILDDTMGLALAQSLTADEFAPTIGLNVQFLSSARPGKLVAKATAAAIVRKTA